jgi:hypothetical protein
MTCEVLRMNEFSTWFNDALKIRFEEVFVQLKQDDLILTEHGKFNVLFNAFMTELSEDMKNGFLQVEETCTRLEALEKEWVYVQGMKDGVRLWRVLIGESEADQGPAVGSVMFNQLTFKNM